MLHRAKVIKNSRLFSNRKACRVRLKVKQENCRKHAGAAEQMPPQSTEMAQMGEKLTAAGKTLQARIEEEQGPSPALLTCYRLNTEKLARWGMIFSKRGFGLWKRKAKLR
jgi:hypothetical protein